MIKPELCFLLRKTFFSESLCDVNSWRWRHWAALGMWNLGEGGCWGAGGGEEKKTAEHGAGTLLWSGWMGSFYFQEENSHPTVLPQPSCRGDLTVRRAAGQRLIWGTQKSVRSSKTDCFSPKNLQHPPKLQGKLQPCRDGEQKLQESFGDSEIPPLQMEGRVSRWWRAWAAWAGAGDRKWVSALALGWRAGEGEVCTYPALQFRQETFMLTEHRLEGRRKLIDRKESSKWKWIIEEQTVIVEGDLINCFRARQGAKSQILCCHKSQKSEKIIKARIFFYSLSENA